MFATARPRNVSKILTSTDFLNFAASPSRYPAWKTRRHTAHPASKSKANAPVRWVRDHGRFVIKVGAMYRGVLMQAELATCYICFIRSIIISIKTRFALITLAIAIAITALFVLLLRWDVVLSYLLAINAVAFGTYGYDKSIASGDRIRVPERVLLLLAFVGGSLGAWLGMKVFHHKTIKVAFRRNFWITVALQVVIVAMYFLVVRPTMA